MGGVSSKSKNNSAQGMPSAKINEKVSVNGNLPGSKLNYNNSYHNLTSKQQLEYLYGKAQTNALKEVLMVV